MDVDAGFEHLNPGPINPSVLTLQHIHRSQAVWANSESEPIRCRRADGAIRRLPQLPLVVLKWLQETGFYGVYHSARICLDHALISAFIERWRQETHTFHLPVGEATVTLEDVSILWGLPIDGDAITGSDRSLTVEQWQDECQELLGFKPNEQDFKKSRLRLAALIEHFGAFPTGREGNEVLVQQYVRGYIMMMIGGFLFPDTSSSLVKLMYLPLLRDLSRVRKLSWGSAVLASLYRGLCHACKHDALEIGGPLVLLQVWIWERIPHMAGTRLRERIVLPPELPPLPLGVRWVVHLKHDKVPAHILLTYRDQLDQLLHDQFLWQPYTKEIMDALPEYCTVDSEIWRTTAPLICFDIVEYHHPERVMRQFGLQQNIPPPCDTDTRLHKIDRRGRSNTDWVVHHASYILEWAQRREKVVSGDLVEGTMPLDADYFCWYRAITRRIIGNPMHRPFGAFRSSSGRLELLTETLVRIYRQTRTDTKVREMALSALRAVGEDHRLMTMQVAGEHEQNGSRREGSSIHTETSNETASGSTPIMAESILVTNFEPSHILTKDSEQLDVSSRSTHEADQGRPQGGYEGSIVEFTTKSASHVARDVVRGRKSSLSHRRRLRSEVRQAPYAT